MKLGTFYFFQATPGQRHADIIRGELAQVMCWMNFGGLSKERVRCSMELFASEVMPRFN